MEKPKFKFKLTISEYIGILKDRKLVNGQFVADSDYLLTELIYKPEINLDQSYVGREVSVHKYDIIEGEAVYNSSETYNIYTGFPITFEEGEECVRIEVNKPSVRDMLRYDEDNFIFYDYYTHPRFRNLQKDVSRESGQMFFREKISSKFVFSNGTFDKIASLNLNQSISLRILSYDYQAGSYTDYFFSDRITKKDFDLDYDRRTATAKFSTFDDYSKIMDRYNEKFKLKDLTYQSSEVIHDVGPMFQIYVEGSDKITNVLAGGFYDTDVTEPELQTGRTVREMLESYGFVKQGQCVEFGFIMQMQGGYTKKITFAGSLRDDYNNPYWYCHGLVNPYYDSRFLFRSDHDSNLRVMFSGTSVNPAKLYITDNTGSVIYYQSVNTYILTGVFNTIANSTILFEGVGDYVGTHGYTMEGLRYNIYTRLLVMEVDLAPLMPTPTQVPPPGTVVITSGFFNQIMLNSGRVPLSSDDWAYSGGNYRYYISASVAPSVLITSDESSENCGFGKKSSGAYYTDENLPLDAKRNKYVPIDSLHWGNASLWMPLEWMDDPKSITYNESQRMSWRSMIDNNLIEISQRLSTLGQILKPMLYKIDKSITFSESESCSKFFYGTDDYRPILTHRTNIQAGQPMQLAQAGELSLKDIMDALKDYFRVYWHIGKDKYGNKRFVMEHVDYFNNGLSHSSKHVNLNIVDSRDAFNQKKYTDAFSEITYDGSELYNRLEFGYADETTEGFGKIGVDLYDKYLEGTGKQETSLATFIADTDYMYAEGGNLNEDGFTMMVATLKADGKYYVNRSPVTIGTYSFYSIYPGNSDMVSVNLLDHYMRDFPGKKKSYGLITVRKVKNFMYSKISIPLVNTFSPYSVIRTKFGVGIVDSMKVDADTNYTEIKIRYFTNEVPYEYNEP